MSPCFPLCDSTDRGYVSTVNCQLSKSFFILFSFIRDADRPVATIPINILGFCCQNTETGAFCLPAGNRLLQYRVIVTTCNDANILYCIGLTNQQLRHRRRCFENYVRHECDKFCMLPLPTIGSASLPHFTHLFMDEAAQATEPESLICLSGTYHSSPNQTCIRFSFLNLLNYVLDSRRGP